MNKKKLTINEIANQAGVSIATVSRVLNGKDSVKSETKEHVLQVIAQLERSHGVNILSSSNTNNPIVLLVAEYESPVLPNFSAGLQEVINEHGYHLVSIDYLKYRGNLSSEINFVAKNMPISAIIMLNNYEEESEVELIANRFPVLTAYANATSKKIASISIDDTLAGQTIANHLLSLGCKDIVLLTLNDSFNFSRLRVKGILETFQNEGIEIPDYNRITLTSLDFGIAASLISQRLQKYDKPDAIIAINDALAAIVIRESKRLGYQVPQDLLVTGFDNEDIATLIEPNLTTINQNSYYMGAQAAHILLDVMENPDKAMPHISLRGELIVRESTL